MSVDVIDVRNRLVGQRIESLKDNATVILSALGVLIASFGLLLGGIALYATSVTDKRVTMIEHDQALNLALTLKLQAELDARDD